MDTKQIITNFLNDQKSFKDFFSYIGEYIDGRFSSCKAVHDANVSLADGVFKERDDKTKANTELAEQNKDLFLECQRLEEKIEELETRAIKSSVLSTQNKVIEKTIEPNVETGIVQLDKDEIDPNKTYTTNTLGRFFLLSAKPIYDYITFKITESDFNRYVEKQENNILVSGFMYRISGQIAIDMLKAVNPNMEVFYRVSHLNLTEHERRKIIVKYAGSKEVFSTAINDLKYIKHSLVLKLGLRFKVGSSSHKRFQKYKNKKPTIIENRTAIENRAEKENKIEAERVSLNDFTDRVWSLDEFAASFGFSKKLLKNIIKDFLGMKHNQSFNAGFVIPKSFLKEFVKLLPINEPYYPPIVFELDDTMIKFTKYITEKKRHLGIITFVHHNEVKKFNLKFKKDECFKKFEQIYNKFEKEGIF